MTPPVSAQRHNCKKDEPQCSTPAFAMISQGPLECLLQGVAAPIIHCGSGLSWHAAAESEGLSLTAAPSLHNNNEANNLTQPAGVWIFYWHRLHRPVSAFHSKSTQSDELVEQVEAPSRRTSFLLWTDRKFE